RPPPTLTSFPTRRSSDLTIAAMNLYENPPVAFLPQQAHGLPGRLGFSPAPGRWPNDSRLAPAQRMGTDLACLRDTCGAGVLVTRSEEHTSELQSLRHLVC